MYEGWTVPIDYDPLLAKLIGYGTDRNQAIGRLVRALNEYFVGGIKTNISLFRRILRDPDFQNANFDTGYLERLLAQPTKPRQTPPPRIVTSRAIAAGVFTLLEPAGVDGNSSSAKTSASHGATSDPPSGWKQTARQESLG